MHAVNRSAGSNFGISRAVAAIVVIVIIVIAGAAGYYLVSRPSSTASTQTTHSTQITSSSSSLTASSSISTQTSASSVQSSSSSTSTSSTSSSSSQSSASIPSTFTWETALTPEYIDPSVATNALDLDILQNVYEPLLAYNGSSITTIIPWLASNYTVSPDGRTINFTLRSGITFADGEPLNSTSVYFSLNRLLVIDSSTPVSHGIGATFLIAQLLNSSISYGYGGAHPYNTAFVNEVLSQNFVQITGPLTFTLHLLNPNVAWEYFFLYGTTDAPDIMAPLYTMQHDVALWNQSSTGYSLPYPTLTGNESSMIYQYYLDEVATCDNGPTPSGCGTTYYDGSTSGSMGGTGPYMIQSVNPSTSDIVLKANPNYWDGPYNVKPSIQTIDINYVPDETTRELDLQQGARSGQAMMIDVTGPSLYDVADRNAWLENGTLKSIIPDVSIYGPFAPLGTNFDPFGVNVTNPYTGDYYSFQPFADQRLRLAFADAVNITELNIDVNNNLGQVANELLPPGLPPEGAYNASLYAGYSFNLTASQDLLLSAMESPITSFTFKNGSAAPAGFFNNTFGCVTLNAEGTCSSPVAQSVSLTYATGDTFDQAIDTQIAGAINNISATYNMGLTVNVTPLPAGIMETEFFAGQLYFFSLGWTADYPWALDFLGPMYGFYTGGYASADGWNLSSMNNYVTQTQKATASDNASGVALLANLMNQMANNAVLYIWTIYPDASFAGSSSAIVVITSNISGYYFNAATSGPYFAALS